MPETEILWDSWGVPHIHASTDADAFRALGFAQMRAHGDLLLKLYAHARGRAAEFLGERYLESDRFVRRMGIPARAGVWAREQSPDMLENLQAFVDGVNAFAERHPDELSNDVRGVLPITLEDVFAHIQRVYAVYLTWGGQRPAGAPFNDVLPFTSLTPDVPPMGTALAGSNAWALAGSRTASGQPILLANPHLYWADYFTFFEAQLRVGDRLSLYGVAQVGWPVLRYGFNDHLGWAHTVNALKGWDAFALEVEGDHYVLDGERQAFERHEERLLVRGPDGVREETLEVLRTAHGPVICSQDGRLIAARTVGFEVASFSRIFEQYWRMANAANRLEFDTALALHQNPMFTVLYADRDGHIAHHFGGFVPKRPDSAWLDWVGTLPGNDSSLIWSQVHDWSELPRLMDPASGWVQNANNPPWTTTLDPQTGKLALDPHAFPAYLTPHQITPREQRSIRMISGLERAGVQDVLACAGSTRSETADRMLPVLLEHARGHGSDLVQRAAGVLERWDRCFEPESVGADLFVRWLLEMRPNERTLGNLWAVPWDEHDPFHTPHGLRDPLGAVQALERAAASLIRDAGTLERPWKALTRASRGVFRADPHGQPDPFGVFRTTGYAPAADGRFDAAFGTTYVCAVEFTQPPQARVLLSYGNSSQPGSKHHGDQLRLWANRETREALLTRSAVEPNLERRETV